MWVPADWVADAAGGLPGTRVEVVDTAWPASLARDQAEAYLRANRSAT